MKTRASPSRKAIIVTGTPGTGKTTLSRKLALQTDANYVSLADFVSARGLFTRIDSRRKSKVVGLKRVRTALDAFLRKTEGLTIIDTHIPEIAPATRVKAVIVLRCYPKILEKRLKSKNWAQRKVRENVLAEVLDVCFMHAKDYYGASRTFQLDTSQMNASSCVVAAKRLLQTPPRRKIRIDWISTLQRERLLDKYLGT